MLPERREEMDALNQQLEILKSNTNTNTSTNKTIIDSCTSKSSSCFHPHNKPEMGEFYTVFIQWSYSICVIAIIYLFWGYGLEYLAVSFFLFFL